MACLGYVGQGIGQIERRAGARKAVETTLPFDIAGEIATVDRRIVGLLSHEMKQGGLPAADRGAGEISIQPRDSEVGNLGKREFGQELNGDQRRLVILFEGDVHDVVEVPSILAE